MCAHETEIEMVRRHVEEGARHISKQRKIIARLKRKNLPTDNAETLLDTFHNIQRQHEEHLARLQGDAGPSAAEA